MHLKGEQCKGLEAAPSAAPGLYHHQHHHHCHHCHCHNSHCHYHHCHHHEHPHICQSPPPTLPRLFQKEAKQREAESSPDVVLFIGIRLLEFVHLYQKTNSCLFSEEAEVNMEEGQERHLDAKAKPFHQPQPRPSLHLTTPHHLKTLASSTVLIYAPLPSTEQCTV